MGKLNRSEGGESRKMRGRPTKFKKDIMKEAELLSGFGFTEKDFCGYWEVSERTFYYWKKKNEGELLQAIEKGKTNANITATKALFNKVQEGNMTAVIFWLTNRCPELWRDRRALVNQQIVSKELSINVGEDESKIRKMVEEWSTERKGKFLKLVDTFEAEDGLKVQEMVKVEENVEIRIEQI